MVNNPATVERFAKGWSRCWGYLWCNRFTFDLAYGPEPHVALATEIGASGGWHERSDTPFCAAAGGRQLVLGPPPPDSCGAPSGRTASALSDALGVAGRRFPQVRAEYAYWRPFWLDEVQS
jgi:hypothetical protein